jgi:hypothetical protein
MTLLPADANRNVNRDNQGADHRPRPMRAREQA